MARLTPMLMAAVALMGSADLAPPMRPEPTQPGKKHKKPKGAGKPAGSKMRKRLKRGKLLFNP